MCDVIVYGKQKQIQKQSLSASICKPPRKSNFLCDLSLGQFGCKPSNYLLAYVLHFAHGTHGGGLQTVSMINKGAFAHVGFYLVKKYWTVSNKLIITLRHYILCFCLLL